MARSGERQSLPDARSGVSQSGSAGASGNHAADRPSGFRAQLNFFDFTLLVVGAIIGADIYIVAGLGASFLGPAQLIAWIIAGFLAGIIGLAFVQCAAIYPAVGGSYAYARQAFGPLLGFATGWALYAGEWVALPVFPLAFVSYLAVIFPGVTSSHASLAIKVLFVGAMSATNFFGVKVGGRLNDVLAVAKLVPLGLLILLGLAFALLRPKLAAANLSPFAPLGWTGMGPAILLIFWAYAGFELAVLPASEVVTPRRTLPRGLIVGMAVSTLVYLLVAFAVVVALRWQVAAASTRSLADAAAAIFRGFGWPAGAAYVLFSLGALVSIASVFDVFVLSVARLSYALAADGLFPSPFGRLHHHFHSPYVGIGFEAMTALAGSLFFDLSKLISIAMFFLGICYALTALSALKLVRRAPDRALHVPWLRPLLWMGALAGINLSLQAPLRLAAAGVAAMAFGFILYYLRKARWGEAALLANKMHTGEQQAEIWARRGEHWLQRSAHRSDRRSRH